MLVRISVYSFYSMYCICMLLKSIMSTFRHDMEEKKHILAYLKEKGRMWTEFTGITFVHRWKSIPVSSGSRDLYHDN